MSYEVATSLNKTRWVTSLQHRKIITRWDTRLQHRKIKTRWTTRLQHRKIKTRWTTRLQHRKIKTRWATRLHHHTRNVAWTWPSVYSWVKRIKTNLFFFMLFFIKLFKVFCNNRDRKWHHQYTGYSTESSNQFTQAWKKSIN